jgi:hypothetical protein
VIDKMRAAAILGVLIVTGIPVPYAGACNRFQL